MVSLLPTKFHEILFSSFRGVALTNCLMDRRTDRQTDRTKTICLPTKVGGDIIYQYMYTIYPSSIIIYQYMYTIYPYSIIIYQYMYTIYPSSIIIYQYRYTIYPSSIIIYQYMYTILLTFNYNSKSILPWLLWLVVTLELSILKISNNPYSDSLMCCDGATGMI